MPNAGVTKENEIKASLLQRRGRNRAHRWWQSVQSVVVVAVAGRILGQASLDASLGILLLLLRNVLVAKRHVGCPLGLVR